MVDSEFFMMDPNTQFDESPTGYTIASNTKVNYYEYLKLEFLCKAHDYDPFSHEKNLDPNMEMVVIISVVVGIPLLYCLFQFVF